MSAGAAADAKDREGVTPLSVAAVSASRSLSYLCPALQEELSACAAETFDCLMAHHSTQPLATAALVTAAAAAADLGLSRGLAASQVDSRQRAVISRLLSTAVQQDIAETRAALLQCEPGGFSEPREGATMMTGVLLDMWLAAAAEQAELEAANFAADGCEGGS
jgi:hypothetical protein